MAGLPTARSAVQVPPGVQCFVGEEARRRRAIEDVVTRVFEGWDYEEIIPPLFDYADVFASPDLFARTYSFVGRDGRVLALRPDFTSLLAKVAAGRLAHREPPIRLYYSGEVVRYEPPRAGRQSELYQMGLEHLGGRPGTADAEVLAVAAECLDAVGLPGCVLTLGHVGVFNALVAAAGLDPASVDTLRERVAARDEEGVRAALRRQDMPERAAAALLTLVTLPGDVAALDILDAAVAPFEAAARAVGELRSVLDLSAAAGLGTRLALDVGELRGLDYYTGLVFRIYARGLGSEIGGGGRYDALLARFGRPMPAVGFMIGLDRVAALLERNGSDPRPARPPAAPMGSLREARAEREAGRRVRLAVDR